MAHRACSKVLPLALLSVVSACGVSSTEDSARHGSAGTGGTVESASEESGGDHGGHHGGAGRSSTGGGEASRANLLITPGSSPMDVGEMAVGKTGTAAAYLHVSNIGNVPTEPLTASTSNPQFVFLVDTCTGTSLDAVQGNTTCQLGLALSPTQTGAIDGTVTVSDGAGAHAFIGVTGTGTDHCLLTATPAALDFGSAPVGAAASSTITLTNTGDTPSGTLAVAMDLNDGRFAVGEDTCAGVSLDPGTSCTITVNYEAHPMRSPNLELIVTPQVGAPVLVPLDGWGIG